MSWDFAGASPGRFVGTMGSTYNPPFTVGWWWKYSDHPAAIQWAFGFSPTDADTSPSIYATTGATDETYVFENVDSSAVQDNASYTAGTSEYNNKWHAIVCTVTGSPWTDRKIYVGEIGNVGTDTDARDIGSAYQYLKINSSMFEAGSTAFKVAEFFIADTVLSTADITDFMGTSGNETGKKPTAFAGANDLICYFSFSADDTSPLDESPSGDGLEIFEEGTDGVFSSDHPTMLAGDITIIVPTGPWR
jgi:hypothetical protein